MISEDTALTHLLDAHPGLLEVLVRHHPRLEQLRTLPRRGPRITVGQAARIAGVDTDALLRILREAVGDAAGPPSTPAAAAGTPALAPRPATLAGLPDSRQVHVDVREDLRRGQEPFARIMGAVTALPEGSALVVRAPFEPVPLYDVLARRGFAHWAECHGAADWAVWFYREALIPGAPGRPGGPAAPGSPAGTRRLDVRGLEPPGPMVRVLEALETLAPGQTLEVLHERRPMFLYPQLDDRGFAHQTEDVAPGLVRVVIRWEPAR